MQKDIVLALKIENADLDEINPVDLATLLSGFSKLLGNTDDVSFQSIRAGSIYIENKTFEASRSEKIHSISTSLEKRTSALKSIEKVLSKYPQWGSASLVTRHISESDEDAKKLYEINSPEKSVSITQFDSFRGRFLGVKEGSDSTDHGSLLLDNGKKIGFALSPELAKTMNHHFRSDVLLEVSGRAKYAFFNYKNIVLESFFVDSFVVIEKTLISDWVKDFADAGSSGWSAFENPIEEWLKDRHA